MQFSVAPVFLPGPRPDPILGWRGALLPFAADPLGYMIGAHRQYGELVALSRSSPVMLFAFGPEHNRQLLSNAQLFHTNVVGGFPVPPDSSVQRITGGLLAMNGAQHQQQRQLMLPSFHRQHVADYRAAMVEMIERVLARWAPGDQRDIAQEMRELTLSVALKTLFSLDHQDEGRALGQLFTQSLEIRISPLEQALPLDLPITNWPCRHPPASTPSYRSPCAPGAACRCASSPRTASSSARPSTAPSTRSSIWRASGH